MKNKNIFNDIPSEIPEEIIQEIVKTGNVRIERIISKGQSSPEGHWYDQQDNEWVILLRGRAGIRFFDNVLIELGEG